jgi:thiol-disulfide isomerase/thioredoxin
MNLQKKYLFLFWASFWLIHGNQAQTKGGMVSLSGTLKHFSNQDELEDVSEFQYLLPPRADRLVISDSNGHFSIRFRLESPNYFQLGRNNLYLSPGDDLKAFIDYDDPMASSFEGRGGVANNYLRATPYPKAGSYIMAGDGLKPTAQATADGIESAVKERKRSLSLLREVSAEFRRLEEARIRADAIISFQFAPVYHHLLNRDSSEKFEKEFERISKPFLEAYRKNFLDASLLKISAYRDIAEDLLLLSGPSKDKTIIKDWYLSSRLVEKMNQINDKDSLKIFATQIDPISTLSYRKALKDSWAERMKFGRGDEAVDFEASDMNDQPVELSSLKGKLIYVDIWATWCGPCMAEMPYLEKLKDQFKDDPGVAFVSLSIDTDRRGWKKNVSERQAQGFQWQIDRSKLNAYNIVGIPRILFVDKNFKMIDMNGTLPSASETGKLIIQNR